MQHRTILVGVLLAATLPAWAVSNVDSVRKYAWGENIGWINARDANTRVQGVRASATYLEGYAWSENTGFINFGDGTPGGGTLYNNVNGSDTGVNFDTATHKLYGLAWGENIGWINFGSNAAASQAALSVAGLLNGYAWGENVGWINVSGMAIALGQRCACALTATAGDADSDSLPDGVEFNPSVVSSATQGNRYLFDSDGDGLADGYEDANHNGLTDAGETNLRKRDTDNDALWDGVELMYLASDPLSNASPGVFTDADGDGLPSTIDPDSTTKDKDGDKLTDGIEAAMCSLGIASNLAALAPIGDANCDGFRTNLDALIVQSTQLGNAAHGLFTGESNSDVNRDGFGTNLDALIIHSYFLGNSPLLPVPAL